MTDKKLTGREALAYMATGGWFEMSTPESGVYQVNGSGNLVYYLEGNCLRYSRGCLLEMAKDGIIPCPDPTVKIDEYEEDKKAVINAIQFEYPSDERMQMIELFEKWFQRKEVK